MVFINATQRTHDNYAQLVGNKLIKKNIWYLLHSLLEYISHASFEGGIGGGCWLWVSRGCWLNLEEVRRREKTFSHGGSGR